MINIKDYEWATESYIRDELEKIFSQKIENLSEQEIYKLILNCIDLTTLEGDDTKQKVFNLCKKAFSFEDRINTVSAICTYPVFVRMVKGLLIGKNIKTACVAGGFPSGQIPIHLKLEEIKYAILEGAEEVDTVISRKDLLEGSYNKVFDEIAQAKEICKNICLKVILETGELQSSKNILIASDLAMLAGADFIKTSTGKISISATETVAYLMLNRIKNHYYKTNRMVGFKAAGGISELKQAKNYLQLVQFMLGNKWLNNNYFRIGASRLADNVFEKIML